MKLLKQRLLICLLLLPALAACPGGTPTAEEPGGGNPPPGGGPPPPDPGPPPPLDPGESNLPQYLTWDGGSGPSSENWSTKLELPWANPGEGDWKDANGDKQGTAPYASGSVAGTGPVSMQVGPLVASWLDSGQNRGFFVNSREAFAFTFHGRESATVAARPTLVVNTSAATFTAPCICNAQWSPSTVQTYDSRSEFRAASASIFAIVQFDLDGITGAVQSATLTLNCKSLTRAGVIEIFEADPPTFRDGGGNLPPQLGIAAGYPLDQGLSAHASVLFASDFADVSDWPGNFDGTTEFDPETQSTALRGVFLTGNTGSCTLERDVVTGSETGSEPTSVETELYARYYVLLESDWGSEVDANKMPGWDGRMGWWNDAGYWQSTTGNGGAKPTGLKVRNEPYGRWEYEGASMRGHGGTLTNDGNPYDSLFWVGGYLYHLDQQGPFGTNVKWNGVVLGKERWYCVEHYIKMNSISGPYDGIGNGVANFDGEYRVWVDGVLAWERTNLRWRRHPEMGIQGFWLNWYHGGVEPVTHEMHYKMNSLVIAREYIGPRDDE